MTKEARSVLMRLIEAIHNIVNTQRLNGSINPELVPVLQWKVTEFAYDDNGVSKYSARTNEILKQDWYRVSQKLNEEIIKLSIYTETIKELCVIYHLEETLCDRWITNLIIKIIGNILEGKTISLDDSMKYADFFLKDLNKESQEYRAEVKLINFVMRPDMIILNDNAVLRKPEKKDLEKEVPIYYFSGIETAPSTFLNIKVRSNPNTSQHFHSGNAIQDEIFKDVSLLRLFRVGSINYTQFQMDSDSFGDPMLKGKVGNGKLNGWIKCLIKDEDKDLLKLFWNNLKNMALPESVYNNQLQKGANELSIAYDRYCDSLETSIVEKQISSAVMGLEALYLPEEDELSYKLRLRVSKVLSLLGHNGFEVRTRLKDAYDIRSTYVHGSILTEKDKQKYEKRYGTLNEFSISIMDYLRLSIVSLIKRPVRRSFIQNIDDSFLDINKENNLKALLFNPYVKGGS